ncbi:MAG: fimbrial outer membrane usher protein TcfC [Henriciella sp.]
MPLAQWGRCLFWLVSIAALSYGAAAEDVIITAPLGWETNAQDDFTIVDVFLNGRKVAAAPARFNSQTIKFEDPAGLAELLPGLRDTEMIARALARAHATNEDYLCGAEAPPKPCDYIYPIDVALIFDPGRLQVEIFINDLHMFSRDSRARHLPPPTVATGLITSFDTRTAYDFDSNRFIGTHHIAAIAGRGRKSVRARVFANTRSQARLQSLQTTHVGDQTAWTVGLQNPPSGGPLSRSRQLIGLRWGSTLLTRMDKAQLNASPVEISVAQSATIEIQRDGQTLDVQQIEPGQTQLDTTRLPSGSYGIDLVIDEGGEVRTETRYYSTSSRLPPIDAPQWYLEAGQAIPFSNQDGFFITGETPVLSIGRHQRIGANTALKLDATLTDDIAYFETALTAQAQSLSGTLSVAAADDGTYGVSAKANGQLSKWSFNGFYRKLAVAEPIGSTESAAYVPFVTSFEQASVSANRRSRWGRLGLRGFFRKGSTGKASWFGGPFVDVTLLERRRWRLNVSLRQEWGSDRETRFFGVRVSKSFDRPSQFKPRIYTQARHDAYRTKNADTSETSNITFSEATARTDLNRTNVSRTSVFGALRHDGQLGARASVNYSSPRLHARLDGRRAYQNQNTALLDMRSGLVFASNGVSFVSTREESGAHVSVKGPVGHSVGVQVDHQTRSVAKSSGHAFVPLKSFSIYDVGIQPERTRNLDYEQHTDRLVAYPGNVIQLVRSVRPITIIVGRLIDKEDAAISSAFLDVQGNTLGMTDRDGYFQIDASPGDTLIARQSAEESCEVILPSYSDPSDVYFDAGSLTCF